MRSMLMGRIVAAFAIVVFGLSLYGCAGVGSYYQPAGVFPSGGIYTDTTSGSLILENGATPTKEGKACGSWIVVVGTGDTSIETAMKNGGVQKVIFVTQTVRSILGPIYGEVCTVVKGN
jgi:NADPH-dependent glutamate synthase beta subunit-like oxidoreductase